MQFSCEQCATRYSVPDERVRGKRVRTKCRKCGSEIVVEGPETALADATRAAPAGPTALGPRLATPLPPRPEIETDDEAPGPRSDEPWTVAISRAERRTMTTAQVVDGYADGVVGEKTLLWKQGMERWQPPFSVPSIALALGARGFAPGRDAKSGAGPTTPPTTPDAEAPASAPVPLSASAFNFDDEATAVIAPDRARELLEAEAAKKTEPPEPEPSETPLTFGFDDESTKVFAPEQADSLLEKPAEPEPRADATSTPLSGSPGPAVLPKAEAPREAEPSIVVADELGAKKPKPRAPAPTPPPAPPKLSTAREITGLQNEPTRVVRMKKQGAGTTFWLVLFLALAAAAAGGFVASQILHDARPPAWLKRP